MGYKIVGYKKSLRNTLKGRSLPGHKLLNKKLNDHVSRNIMKNNLISPVSTAYTSLRSLYQSTVRQSRQVRFNQHIVLAFQVHNIG